MGSSSLGRSRASGQMEKPLAGEPGAGAHSSVGPSGPVTSRNTSRSYMPPSRGVNWYTVCRSKLKRMACSMGICRK